MGPQLMGVLAAEAAEAAEAAPACAVPGSLCNWVWEATGNATFAALVDYVLLAPVHILIIVVIAFFARWLLNRLLRRITTSMGEGKPLLGLGKVTRLTPNALWVEGSNQRFADRREQRARTMRTLGRNIINVLVFGIAAMLILAELGINVGPIIASAGIAGLAISFGAKSVIEDFISGLFMVLEDQFGIGDLVDVGEASGIVEAITLRVTSIRDVDGVLWHVRNGQIVAAGNKSQGWARAVVDVAVSYGADLPAADRVIREAVRDFAADPVFAKDLMEEPEVWGVDRMTSEGVVVRVAFKTVPLQQAIVGRGFRQLVRERLTAAGVRMQWEDATAALRGQAIAAAEPPAPGAQPASRPPLL